MSREVVRKMAKGHMGARIRGRRDALGWTQEELAVKMKRPDAQPQIAKWEAGRSSPTGKNLALLAKALGVSMDYLATGAEEQAVRDAALLAAVRRKAEELCQLLGLIQPAGVAELGRESFETAAPPDERRVGGEPDQAAPTREASG